jgi:hypothetical protein
MYKKPCPDHSYKVHHRTTHLSLLFRSAHSSKREVRNPTYRSAVESKMATTKSQTPPITRRLSAGAAIVVPLTEFNLAIHNSRIHPVSL